MLEFQDQNAVVSPEVTGIKAQHSDSVPMWNSHTFGDILEMSFYLWFTVHMKVTSALRSQSETLTDDKRTINACAPVYLLRPVMSPDIERCLYL